MSRPPDKGTYNACCDAVCTHRGSPTVRTQKRDIFHDLSHVHGSFSNSEDSRPVPLAPPSSSSPRSATELRAPARDPARRTAPSRGRAPPLKNSDAAKKKQKRQRTNRRTNRERRTQNQPKIDQITMIRFQTLHWPSQGSCQATPRRSWLKPTLISEKNRSWPRTRKSPKKQNSKLKPNS